MPVGLLPDGHGLRQPVGVQLAAKEGKWQVIKMLKKNAGQQTLSGVSVYREFHL